MVKSNKQLSKGVNQLMNSYKKSSHIEKLLGVFLLLLLGSMIYNRTTPIQEGFEEVSGEYVSKKGIEVYDNFYANIYDNLLYNKIKNKFEVESIVNISKPTSQSVILDVGSGTGHHVNMFSKLGYKTIGIDISPAMVNASKKNFPMLEFKRKNALDKMALSGESFTHITCLYFTLYYMEDKNRFFSNCYHWLKPGGYLIIHLVNKKDFDPIVPAGNPFLLVSPQKYAKKRITSTEVKFMGYDYKSNFEIYPNDTTAVFNETFKDKKDGSVRYQEQILYMPTQKRILNMAKDNGFILNSQIDMKKCKYNHQYLYILQKPN